MADRDLVGDPTSPLRVFVTYDANTLVIASITAINTDTVSYRVFWTWNGTPSSRVATPGFNQTFNISGNHKMTIDSDGIVVPPVQLTDWGYGSA